MIQITDRPFLQLQPDQLYDLLALRSRVFVVEQNCVYLDCDGHDKPAQHLLMTDEQGKLIAAARILPPGTLFEQLAVGRVVVDPAYRGRGLGHELVRYALAYCDKHYPDKPIHISAQQHLRAFYASHGFTVTSQPYLEDGIWHVAMIRAPQVCSSDNLPNSKRGEDL